MTSQNELIQVELSQDELIELELSPSQYNEFI